MSGVLWGLLSALVVVFLLVCTVLATPVKLAFAVTVSPQWRLKIVARLFGGLTPAIAIHDSARQQQRRKARRAKKKKATRSRRMLGRFPRVVAAMPADGSCRAVAERFGVAPSSVVKWTQRFRETGSVAPGKRGGHRKCALEAHYTFIVERVSEAEHLTSRSLRDELAMRGVIVSHDTVWRFLRGHGLTFKKKPVRK